MALDPDILNALLAAGITQSDEYTIARLDLSPGKHQIAWAIQHSPEATVTEGNDFAVAAAGVKNLKKNDVIKVTVCGTSIVSFVYHSIGALHGAPVRSLFPNRQLLQTEKNSDWQSFSNQGLFQVMDNCDCVVFAVVFSYYIESPILGHGHFRCRDLSLIVEVLG